MKFQLFGDLDCPDWIIAHFNALSRLTSIKLRMLCNEVFNDLKDPNKSIDFDKIIKITSDAKFDEEDCRAVFAALSYILQNAWKFDVKPNILGNELQQLGLPKEHTLSLTKVYSEKHKEARQLLKNLSLRMSRLVDVEAEAINGIEIDEIKTDIKLGIVNFKIIKNGQLLNEKVCLTKEKLFILIRDLKNVKQNIFS